MAVVRQELQALMEKHESLERDSKTQSPSLPRLSKVPGLPRPMPISPFRRLSW